MTLAIPGIIVTYLATMVVLAYLARSKSYKGVEEFYIGGRRMPGFGMAMTYAATTYSVFMMVGLVGLTYAHGVGALGFELTYLMSTVVILAFFGPMIWALGRKRGYITIGQLYSDRFGSRAVGATMAILCTIFLVPYMALQAIGSAYLLETLSGIPYFWGMTFIVATMFLTSLVGGFRGIVITDIIQGLVMLFSSVALVIFLFSLIGGPLGLLELEKTFPKITTVPGDGFFSLPTFISLTLPWAFFALTNPQVSQKIFSPKDRRAFRAMIFGFFIFGFFYTILSILVGLEARLLEPSLQNPDMATPILLKKYVPLPLSILVILGIISAGVTTVNSIMLSLASLIDRDVLRGRHERVWVGCAIVTIEAILVWFFSLAKHGLISLLAVMSSACLLSQVPIIVLGLLWRRGSALAAVSSMVAGSVITAVLYMSNFALMGLGPAVFGLIASLLIYVILALTSKASRDDFIEELNACLREEGFL